MLFRSHWTGIFYFISVQLLLGQSHEFFTMELASDVLMSYWSSGIFRVFQPSETLMLTVRFRFFLSFQTPLTFFSWLWVQFRTCQQQLVSPSLSRFIAFSFRVVIYHFSFFHCSAHVRWDGENFLNDKFFFIINEH